MSEEQQELLSLIEQLRIENSELKRRNSELEEETGARLNQKRLEVEQATADADRLRQQLEDSQTLAELERLRAVESLRQEHQRALRREQDLADYERDRVRDLTEANVKLEEKVRALTVELESTLVAASRSLTPPGVDRGVSPVHSGLTTEVEGEATGATGVTADSEAGERADLAAVSGDECTLDLVEDGSEPPSTPRGVTGGMMSSEAEDASGVLATVSRLLQAQTEALAAQTRATTAQHLPPLKSFTGEGKVTEDDSFERWLEHFEERASLAGWSKNQQLHQLKLLLEKTALKAFRVLPEEERDEYDRAVAALKSRFRSVDIEELRGLEFHQRVQQVDETVEDLGMELQRLGHKAFPSMQG